MNLVLLRAAFPPECVAPPNQGAARSRGHYWSQSPAFCFPPPSPNSRHRRFVAGEALSHLAAAGAATSTAELVCRVVSFLAPLLRHRWLPFKQLYQHMP
jgi:hypothetical protein